MLLIVFSLMLSGAQGKRYSGSWKSEGAGGGGNIAITLGTTAADSSVVFTLGMSDVKTTIQRLKLDGDAFEIAYDFDVEGNRLTSIVSGKRQGAKIEGRYRTVVTGSDEQVDSGTLSGTE